MSGKTREPSVRETAVRARPKRMPPRDLAPAPDDTGVGQVGAHPLRPLREHLERQVLAERHHGEDLVDVLVGELLVEEVAHGVDEDAPRLPPAEGFVELCRDELDAAGPARARGRHLREAGKDTGVRVALLERVAREPRRDPLGVAVAAALGDPRAAPNGVPRRVGPGDAGAATHWLAPRSPAAGTRRGRAPLGKRRPVRRDH